MTGSTSGVSVVVTGSASLGELQKAASYIEQQQNRLGKSAGTTSKAWTAMGTKLQSVGQSMQSAGKTMTLGVTAPLVAIGAYAFNTAAEFQTSMNQVAAATNAPAAEMAKLGELAKKMGAETIYSANESGLAMLELAKSGLTPAQISAGALDATMRLAAAGGVDLASAATTTANALNMFGMDAGKAGEVANAFAGGANASSASVESLQQALSQVGPGARNAGLSLNDTVGVLAAFADKGIQGSDAGTSLKTMLTRLVPATDKAEKAMKAYGLSFVDSKGNIDDITVVAQKLQDKLGTLSEAERSEALTTLFGSDATRAATVLMQEGTAGIEKYIKATKDQTAAQAMADARMGGAAGAMERMKGSVETAALALGEALAPTVSQVAGVVEKLANKLSALSPKTQDLIVKVGLVVAAIGPALVVFGKLTSLTGGVVKGVGGVIGAFHSAGQAGSGFGKAMFGAYAGVRNFATGLTNAAASQSAFATTATKLGGVVRNIAGGFRDLIVQVGYNVKAMAISAATWVRDTASKVANTVATWASIAAQKAAAVGAKLWAAGQWLLNAALTANPIGLVVAAIALLVAGFVWAWKNSDKFREVLTKGWEAIKAGAVKIFNGIVAFFKQWGPWVLAALAGPVGIVAKLIIDNWDKIKSGTVKAFTAALDFIKGIPGKILAVFASAGRWLFDTGKNIVLGLWNGLQSMASWLTTQVTNWIKAVLPDPIEKALGINSPSKVFREIGTQTGQGLALGLEDKSGRVTQAARYLADATVRGMADLPDKIRAIAREARDAEIQMLQDKGAVREAKKALEDAKKSHGDVRLATLELARARDTARTSEGKYKEVLSKSKDQISEFTEKAEALLKRRYGDATFKVGQDAAQGLANGLNNKYGVVYAAVKKLADKGIKGNLKKLLEVQSPSRVMMEIGQYIGDGLARGMESSTRAVKAAADRMARVATVSMAAPAFADASLAFAGGGGFSSSAPMIAPARGSGSAGGYGSRSMSVTFGAGAIVVQAPAGTDANLIAETTARKVVEKIARERRRL